MSSSFSAAAIRAFDEAHAVMAEVRRRHGRTMGEESVRTMSLMVMTRMSVQEEILTGTPVRGVAAKAPTAVLSLQHLPHSSNRTDEVCYHAPFGTYVLVGPSRSGTGYDAYQLHFVEGAWNEGAWLECDRSETPVLAQGVTYEDACSLLLHDVTRRWRETPPVPERIEGASIEL